MFALNDNHVVNTWKSSQEFLEREWWRRETRRPLVMTSSCYWSR